MTNRRRTAASAALALLALAVAAPSRAPAQEMPSQAPATAPRAPTDNAVLWNVDQVVAIAVARHPLVSQADMDTRAAGARKGQAESAYYPAIGLTAGALRDRAFSAGAGRPVTTTSEFIEGNLNQLITDFGRTGATVRRSDAFLASARETGRSVREDVAFQAKLAYYAVLRAGRILEVNRETVRQRESLSRQAQAFYDAGIRARIDVARAEANLFQARADLTSAENALRVARITLLNRMGVDGPRDFALVDTLAGESFPGALDEWLREAEGNRPDLRSLLERQRAAQENLRAARGGYFPILAGSAGYGYAGEDFPLQEAYNVAVSLSVPVFTGFLTREQVREAEAQLASARYAVDDFRRLVRLQVEQAALSLRESSERTEAREKERDASAENLRLATGRYEVGAGDIIEIIDAQVQMAGAETNLINALYDSSVSIATLLRAVGR